MELYLHSSNTLSWCGAQLKKAPAGNLAPVVQPLAIPSYIGMRLKEIGWEVMDRMQLVQDRDNWRIFVNTVMSLRVL
jgi:hypothetical protein